MSVLKVSVFSERFTFFVFSLRFCLFSLRPYTQAPLSLIMILNDGEIKWSMQAALLKCTNNTTTYFCFYCI